jgi:uncharacterized OB-fold protein
MLTRVIPVPSEDTLPFWQAAAHGILALPRCTACSAMLYPPRPRCPVCASTALAWVDITPRATLRTWSEVSIDGPLGLSAPFIVARATLDEAGDLPMVANLVSCASPERGMALTVKFEALEGSAFAIPQFVPLEPAA